MKILSKRFSSAGGLYEQVTRSGSIALYRKTVSGTEPRYDVVRVVEQDGRELYQWVGGIYDLSVDAAREQFDSLVKAEKAARKKEAA